MTIEQALRDARLGSLSLSDPACVPRGTSLAITLGVMRENGVGCVLVCDGERVVGIFTERDVLNKLIGSGISESEPVDRFMTSNPASLRRTDCLGDAVRMMTERGYRHIPLLDERGRRAGMIAARDIVNYVAEHFPAEVVNLPPRLDQVFQTPEGG
ncbi:MAG: CBS domain-containing protein [Acidobacteria bacterium]|nr:CBS domain-containing protein [Acidobacteriota bacterium]MBI2016668.1 CBS domain-containing protein [Candidatus Rokubacteria bacterium]